ncbi:MAG TPA: ribonuclease J [Anaerolineaceae bacterium]|nr:ribonuclease J [Anaerolineaceae bacterium]
MKSKVLRIIPLGGFGEVGKNMMVYEFGGEILVVDAGLMFPENDMLGVDYIIPDFQYLLDKRSQVKGIIITHGHEDHIGAIHHLLQEIQAPIYATPLTRGLLEVKLARNNAGSKAVLNTVQAGETVQIGSFKVDFFHVCHSIPDGVGLGIETPAGLVVHTGDFKLDHTPVDNWPTDYAKLAEFSKRGVLLLMSDSTNAERHGWTPSERVIDNAFEQAFRKAPGRIIVASFASLISRMQQVSNAAVRHNRKLAFVGVSMVDNMKIARKLGYLNIPDDSLVSIDQALNMPDDEVVIMCTGSQGEPASILGRLAKGAYNLFDVKLGDTVIHSSHPIPGNEEKVYSTINRLLQRGADVVYEAVAQVHVSGHASQEEQKMMLNMVKPKYFIPMHGELRHMRQHAFLGLQVGIPEENIAVVENGQVIEFKDGVMRVAERIPGGYIYVDGSVVSGMDPDLMRERELLSQDGVIIISLVLDKDTGRLAASPDISSKGFMVSKDTSQLFSQLRSRIAEIASRSDNSLQRDIERSVRDMLYNEVRRRPMVVTSIIKV